MPQSAVAQGGSLSSANCSKVRHPYSEDCLASGKEDLRLESRDWAARADGKVAHGSLVGASVDKEGTEPEDRTELEAGRELSVETMGAAR